MRKVLKFVKGKRDDKKEHGSSGRSIGPFSDLPSPVDQSTPTDEHCTGFEQSFGYHVDLSGKDKTITKLHKAAWQGNLEKLKVNMKKIDIDVVDRLNRTPLHLAAAQGHANVVWFLLGNKANFNICDNEGKTPFLKAIECGHKETIQIMLERGVDINTIDYSGNSGLHIAAKQGFYEIASMLLKQGANFESSNNLGEFPLHIATVAEHKDLVELLLRYGSSVNIVDRDNRSPLMFAAKCGSMTLVQLFLEYGAQRAVMDSNDWTAEDYALMAGHQDIAAELKSPSERMVMSYTEKRIEPQVRDMGIVSTKRSISDASLPPDPPEQEKEDVNVAEKQTEEADNSDTWNDSQTSDSSFRQKGAGLKLTKFLPPSSDDEISEESIHSPRVQEMKEEEIQDSPRSCVIPPPCKPPRSWDLIQSGVIDDPKGLEPRRRSLLPLGSLRSRRESFNESPSAAESPSFNGDSPHIGQGDADQWLSNQSFRKSEDKRDSLPRHLNLSETEGNRDSPSTRYEDIQVKSIHEQDESSNLHKEKKESSARIGPGGDGKESLKESSSESDWDSDDSLPLDNYPPVANVTISPAENDESPMKVFRVINPNELDVPNTANDPKEGSPYSLNSEKRNRFLRRAPSIDLTDDDTETGKNKHSHSPVTSEVGKNKLDTKEDSEINLSASGTLGRDGTLLGYEEMWESNAHIPKATSVISGGSSAAGDAQISIKEELEESLVWSSPQFDGSNRILSRPENKKNAEDNLLYPSPRFDQKPKKESENEGTTKQASVDDIERRSNGLKLESRSLDALEPQTYVSDVKVPRSRKHSRQQSISVQQWSKSEELHDKSPSGAHFDRMAEENKRINAQLRCYDEALRDLAHVTVVRKQSSLSLPRAKETSGLARSQSAGSRNEGFFSLSSASDFAPREMAQSAIVKKQGSLSLPRTSEIPDFAMVQSLGPRKQGHSSLPSTNEFGIREMAQTAIVKRQGSLSLPRTCEIPDFAAAANEEYLSLPRSNELIDEAFKEIGQSSVTMKRGSRSLPRSIDAKMMISLGADPVPPPRHKKSHSRRRADSEGEASNRSSKDTVSKSLSLDVKILTSKGTESSSPSITSPVKEEVGDVSAPNTDADDTPSSENPPSSGITKDISVEKPIRKKRKMLLAMRGFLGPSHKNLNDSTVSEVSVEESFDEPPFWMSTDKSGLLERQATVIERPKIKISVSPAKLEAVESEERQEPQQQSPVKEPPGTVNDTQPSQPLHEEAQDIPVCEETASCGEKAEEDEQQLLPQSHQKDSPEIQRDSQSDDAESVPSHSDNTPQHVYVLKGHHNLLKQHLQKATAEKGRLEETAAELGEKAEKLKYELAEAREAARSRDEVIALLEDQLNRLEEMYTKSLEESQKYKLRLGNLEQELKHLKEVCVKHEDEKTHLTEIIRLKEMENQNLDKSIIAKEEEQRLQALIGEKYEQKQEEMEIHMNCIEMEKNKLKEEINKLELKNGDLRQKLDAVVTRNQLLSEEKAAICAKNAIDTKTLQEHSEKWKQLYETCMEKLRQIISSKSSVDNEAKTSLIERDVFKDEMQKIILKIEETREKDYDIWHTKIQEDVLNAVQLLNAEYSRLESSLLKHNEKIELLLRNVLGDLKASPLRHAPDEDASTSHEAFKLVEELTQLNTELRGQYQHLIKQLESRQEELKKRSETFKPNAAKDSEESSMLEQELRKENAMLKERVVHLLKQSPQNSRELWYELKDENAKLKEQIGILVERVKQEEERTQKQSKAESLKSDGIKAENDELKQQIAQLKQQIGKTEDRCDRAVTASVLSIKETKSSKDKTLKEDELEQILDRVLHQQEILKRPFSMEESSPTHVQALWNELKNANIELQKRVDLLVKHIREKEDEREVWSPKKSDDLYAENMRLKQKIKENEEKKDIKEEETLTDPMHNEYQEQYKDLLNKLKAENAKLKDQLHALENHILERGSIEDRGVMTDPVEWKEEKYCKDENVKLRREVLWLQNKIRQQEFKDLGTEFSPLYEEDENSHLSDIEKMEDEKETLIQEDQKLQEHYNKSSLEKLIAENRGLKQRLNSITREIEEMRMDKISQDRETTEVHPVKMETIQTMTDPDIEMVHMSMENAALQSQLLQLSREYKEKKEELERTLTQLRESRDASSLLLKEIKEASSHENIKLKKDLAEMKRKLKNQEQEILKNRVSSGTPKESQPAKVAELCNLLDYLRKENTELQAQLKKMLAEKVEKDEVEFGCQTLYQSQTASKDITSHHSVDQNARAVSSRNLDSISRLFAMGYPISLEEAQSRKSFITKPNDIEVMNVSLNSEPSTVFASIARDESKHPVVPSTSMREQELQTIDFTHSQAGSYSMSLYPPMTQAEREKQNDFGCSALVSDSQSPCHISNGCKCEIIESKDITQESFKDEGKGNYASKFPSASAFSGKVTKLSQYKDNTSSSSEVYSEGKSCQNQIGGEISSDSINSASQEPLCKAHFRPSRDAATNTHPSAQNLELQRELQVEKDKCKKYQQNVKKLKSDIQLLKSKLGESRKQGKLDANLALKQNNTNNNNTLLASVPSPSHYDSNLAEFQRQVAELEQKVREENSMRFALEVQVNKMRYELQEKLQLEKELSMLRNRLEKDFVSRYELEQLRNSYEVALSRAKYEAEMAARDDLNEKLCQINSFIEKQHQSRPSRTKKPDAEDCNSHLFGNPLI
ncbi:ankyrin repeat domain-containing protein 26-like isoform X3 [Periplaneta americana]|uniref:ankyrin repeat domain-containing protein 26-like isoform X3 n=1 Tax=Periplaneta americana TaxID=6978 RepID=UPI0037E89660